MKAAYWVGEMAESKADRWVVKLVARWAVYWAEKKV